jgi:hypothetical protein
VVFASEIEPCPFFSGELKYFSLTGMMQQIIYGDRIDS